MGSRAIARMANPGPVPAPQRNAWQTFSRRLPCDVNPVDKTNMDESLPCVSLVELTSAARWWRRGSHGRFGVTARTMSSMRRVPRLLGAVSGKVLPSLPGSIARTGGQPAARPRLARDAPSRETSIAKGSAFIIRLGRPGMAVPELTRPEASAGFATRPKPGLQVGRRLGSVDDRPLATTCG